MIDSSTLLKLAKFKTVSKTLTLFFADRKAGRYTLHTGDVFDHTDWTDSQFKAG